MQQPTGRVKLTEVNPHLVCVLCHGYFIDATTMAECPHSFCRSCIVLYLETKSYCPICEVQIHKTKPHLNLKPDKTLQDIVYKLVPGLYHDEMKRRRDFYANYPNRDLYLGLEARGVGVERIIYSPEDSISLSLEYYDDEREKEEWASARPGTSAEAVIQQQMKPPTPSEGMKRFLRCPAVVTMKILKKFIRLKYGLSQACTVEILYRRESLPDSYSLMDIAYIYTWKRVNGPMRFYFRIHVPTPQLISTPLKPSTEPIRDLTPCPKTLRSPELLDAVGLRPKPPEERVVPKFDLDTVMGKKITPGEVNGAKKEEGRKTISAAEDAAVSLLLSLSNGGGNPQVLPEPKKQVPSEAKVTQIKCQPKVSEESCEPKLPESCQGTRNQSDITASDKLGNEEEQKSTGAPPEFAKPSVTGNGGVFKVPQSMTKRFVFNGGKLVAVKSNLPKNLTGKPGKAGDKTKMNGKLNGDNTVTCNRFDPLGLGLNGSMIMQGGRLPPGSPRPPPNSEKLRKTKYMPPSGILLNRLNPETTVTQNKANNETSTKHSPEGNSSQPKQTIQTPPKPKEATKPSSTLSNGQPAHRKEVNRLEQIVQNCLKKERALKPTIVAKSGQETEAQGDADIAKRSDTLSGSDNVGEDARAVRGLASIEATDHTDAERVDSEQKEEASILKRKLNDPLFPRRPEVQNGHGDLKKRRLVTPDVSIELMAKPVKDKMLQKERKREPSDLSSLTKRFLHDIQRMKKLDSELKINKLDQMCASTVKIEKVPAPRQTTPSPKSSPGTGDKTKAIDGSDFSSEDDQLFIDIRNKCEALKRKKSEPASIAIERVSEDPSKISAIPSSPTKTSESPTTSSLETPPKLTPGTHKKLPKLIEINAPPRPKVPALIPDPKQKTGLKMTTVRKEVPIGKEGPTVRRDSNGALDLSSGMLPPGTPKNGNKSPFHRSSAIDKSPSPSSLSSLMAMSSFPLPDTNKGSPIRIPTLKPKTSPTPRPSSLSSSSPSPPADSRSTPDPTVFPTAAYQQLYRHQMELQNRLLASQVNNNTWSGLSAKKFEDWMRSVMNIPNHPLVFPSQLSPEAGRK